MKKLIFAVSLFVASNAFARLSVRDVLLVNGGNSNQGLFQEGLVENEGKCYLKIFEVNSNTIEISSTVFKADNSANYGIDYFDSDRPATWSIDEASKILINNGQGIAVPKYISYDPVSLKIISFQRYLDDTSNLVKCILN